MKKFRRVFLELLIDYGALEFKPRRLNSGRMSPYFVNMGMLSDAAAFVRVGDCYAEALLEEDFVSEEIFPVLLGPPYKGIPLATATILSLYRQKPRLNLSLSSFRKEEKDHAEGGFNLWACLEGGQHVVVLDDVISKGATVVDAVTMAQRLGAFVDGVLLGFDRQERGTGDMLAVSEIQNELGVPVKSIAGLSDLMEFIRGNSRYAHYLPELAKYSAKYGVV